MTETAREIEKYGLNKQEYESCLQDIRGKLNGLNDMDWSEIVEKYHLSIHSDTLRKVSKTIFGGVFVAEYLIEKAAEGKQKSICRNFVRKSTKFEKRDKNSAMKNWNTAVGLEKNRVMN